MFSYLRLKQYIASIDPTTITVDVFDTLLLRKSRSEQWHFWQFAKIASELLQTHKVECSALLYFSLRNYFNAVLRGAHQSIGKDYEASIDMVNAEIIAEICRRNAKKLSVSKTNKLCKELVEAELVFECSQLAPNTRLIELLANTNVPIYFVTDMYFTSSQIIDLFQKMNVHLTVNGISSSDYLVGKSSRQSFARLLQKYPNISTDTNLHIGDHKYSDVRVPHSMGMETFWLNLPLHRTKLFITKYWLGLLTKLITSRAKKQNFKLVHQSATTELKSRRIHRRAKGIGLVFGPSILYYCHYLSATAIASKKTPLLISSESITLSAFCQALGYKKPTALPTFGRKLLLQSYCYQQHLAGVEYASMINMIKKVQRRKNSFEGMVTLGALNPNTNLYYLLGKSATLEHVAHNEFNLNNQLEDAYQSVLQQFSEVIHTDNLSKVLLGDVGWNNTIQILLGETLKNTSHSGELSGLYLGLTGANVFNRSIHTQSNGVLFNSLKGTAKYLYQPEVWESFLNTDNVSNPLRESILGGIKTSITCYQKSDLSPADYYHQSQSLLLKTLAAPSKKIIQVFAGLDFDYGTGNETAVPMVNTTHTTWYAYKLLLRDRDGFKQFYHNQAWKWGAASWYHFRIIYRLWRKKTHKPSF
jgi:hypothetical protein